MSTKLVLTIHCYSSLTAVQLRIVTISVIALTVINIRRQMSRYDQRRFNNIPKIVKVKQHLVDGTPIQSIHLHSTYTHGSEYVCHVFSIFLSFISTLM